MRCNDCGVGRAFSGILCQLTDLSAETLREFQGRANAGYNYCMLLNAIDLFYKVFLFDFFLKTRVSILVLAYFLS